MNRVTKQQGLTLIEMMIAIVIGLIVSGITITLFLTTLRANNDDMKMIRLNQEMRAIMNIMVRDLRRADYWAGTTASPFEVTWLDGTSPNPITFSYDADADGVDDLDTEDFGYRWQGAGNAIEMLDTSNSWVELSDNEAVTINGLSFDVALASTVDNTAIRTVNITMSAEISTDSTVSKTITETVRLRNVIIP